MFRVGSVYPLKMKGGFFNVSSARRFRTPNGIARGVLGVWLLPFPTYFNCCPFLIKTLNYRSPSWDHLIFMSRNGNSSIVTTRNLSSFVGKGGFA